MSKKFISNEIGGIMASKGDSNETYLTHLEEVAFEKANCDLDFGRHVYNEICALVGYENKKMIQLNMSRLVSGIDTMLDILMKLRDSVTDAPMIKRFTAYEGEEQAPDWLCEKIARVENDMCEDEDEKLGKSEIGELSILPYVRYRRIATILRNVGGWPEEGKLSNESIKNAIREYYNNYVH